MMKKTTKKKTKKYKVLGENTQSANTKQARSSKSTVKSANKNSTPTKRKVASPKIKNVQTPVEVTPMLQSPKAAEVGTTPMHESIGGMLNKTNEHFSPRNQFRHQSR